MPLSTLPASPSFSTELTGNALGTLIAYQSERLTGRTYLKDARTDRQVTFDGLARAVSAWANRLDGRGVEGGATVGLAITDPLAFSVAFLGTIVSGRGAAPIDPNAPGDGMAAALSRVHADVVVSDQPIPGTDPRGPIELAPDRSPYLAFTSHDAGPPSPAVVPAGWSGALLASSGTTGPPKLIPLHQDQLLHTAASVVGHHRLTSEDRGFNPLPLFHINAEVVGLLSTLVAGSQLVVDQRFHRSQFWELMEKHRITWINAVPAIISRLAHCGADEVVPSRIRFIRSASAPLPVATLDEFQASTGIPVLETYGMTEASSQIAANPLRGIRKPGSVGFAVDVELRIVTDVSGAANGEITNGGQAIGHIEIRGPSVITAYGGGDHQDRFDADGWLRTGDLGHFDQDGYLFLDARSDDLINRGGEKVFPREIEEVILLDPDVAEAVVVGVPDQVFGQVPIGYLTLRSNWSAADHDSILGVLTRVCDRLDMALSRSKQPVAMRVVGKLPTGLNGKVKRSSLRDSGLTALYEIECR